MKEMVFQIPFYGKAGSISKVEAVSREDHIHHYLINHEQLIKRFLILLQQQDKVGNIGQIVQNRSFYENCCM